jgi:hypothetical protein
MATRAGPLATINCEPRQTWKGAAAAVDSCASVAGAGCHPYFSESSYQKARHTLQLRDAFMVLFSSLFFCISNRVFR